jgi:hypothetical protein
MIGPGRTDVHVGLGHLTRRLAATARPVFVDLLEVAAYVYAADQLSITHKSRGRGDGIGIHSQTRQIVTLILDTAGVGLLP